MISGCLEKNEQHLRKVLISIQARVRTRMNPNPTIVTVPLPSRDSNVTG